MIVQNHIHAGQRIGRIIHLLPVDGHACLGFVGRLEQEGAGATGGIIDSLALILHFVGADDPGNDARDLGGSVELSLTLARFGREVAHQIFVGVSKQIVALCAVLTEVQGWILKDRHQIREAILHLLPLAQLIGIIEVRHIDHAFEIVVLGELRNNLVDLIADLFIAFQCNHIGKSATRRNLNQRIALTRIFVGDVFYEEEDENIILILRGVHPTTKFIAAFPQ